MTQGQMGEARLMNSLTAEQEPQAAPTIRVTSAGEAFGSGSREWRLFLQLLGLMGAYMNMVVYGFAYGRYNHEFDLALVNLLRDPSLYPHDPIKEVFAHFPTIFWPIVARLSAWYETETVLLMFFLLTKLVFFAALARIVGTRVEDRLLATTIVLAVAQSPFLNDLTPLGASDVLSCIQTHAPLAIALLLWVGCFLLEGKWLTASALCALTIYVDALFSIHTLFAFAAFAVFDWRRRRSAIVSAGLLGAAISLPWLLLGSGTFFRQYPKDYVEALIAFYPFHLTLRSHDLYGLLSGVGVALAAAGMVLAARKAGALRDTRFELLTASFLIPVVLGAVFGEFFLTPMLARLQLLRADSFLLLYSILLVQVYAASVLRASTKGVTMTFFLCAVAILLPLSDFLGLLWLLFIAMILWADPRSHFERFWRAAARSEVVRQVGWALFVAAITAAALADTDWSTTSVILLAILAGCLFVYDERSAAPKARLMKLTAGVCIAVVLMIPAGTVPEPYNMWNFTLPLWPHEEDWRAVQRWALVNTPREAQFLVPTYPCGFRVFSERSSWGEWKDGQAMYHYPPFADVYRERMATVGYSWAEWRGADAIEAGYRRLSWEKLLQIARHNHLDYIIEFRDMSSPMAPVFANDHYAVYKVSP